jgi:hypothetical protein
MLAEGQRTADQEQQEGQEGQEGQETQGEWHARLEAGNQVGVSGIWAWM